MSADPDKDSSEDTDPQSWVDLYGDYLYNYALSRVRDNSAAEDLVQETFLAALQAHGSFAGQSTIRTWLVGILKHKLIDYLRKLFRDAPDDPGAADSSEAAFVASGKWKGHWDIELGPVEWGSDPGRIMESKEFLQILDFCMQNLPIRLATAFTLYQMEELPSDEICKILGVTTTNLWVMLHRTRRQLRHCLEVHWIGHQHGREKKDR